MFIIFEAVIIIVHLIKIYTINPLDFGSNAAMSNAVD